MDPDLQVLIVAERREVGEGSAPPVGEGVREMEVVVVHLDGAAVVADEVDNVVTCVELLGVPLGEGDGTT
jgi:hypothetical protein